ncbi:multicopper oxidase family protein [Amycolatopsis azurea]|uniref:Multicopper oxidase CueO n=1 Tax=Amycolatopsis azurea DSM 43854 TaxID=1238180 RepID=M2P2A6_9PSEU|nr:multicopper oxidase domain-containing protein [Amycolatopsis azurea]EMD29264.1 Multicopper oxidase [Amycolatopsis azurea DSM 43854]OOC01898.1 hypothetical protein B0293_36985 [Amycolatopsis azurea DSM 43854]
MSNRRQFLSRSVLGLGLAAIPVTVLAAGVGQSRAATDLTKFADPLPIPPVLRPGPTLSIRQIAGTYRAHSQLPLTPVWTYEGSFPGPVIDVRRGSPVTVTWTNKVEGRYPVTAVEVPFTGIDSILGVGRGDATPLPDVAALAPKLVTHLHGGAMNADSDGWPMDLRVAGQAQIAKYPNVQRASTLWYHDHAMDVTAYTVHAGLAGFYLVRDPEEDALRLPSGIKEIPLVLADRNLDTDATGAFNGRFLHKIGYYDTALGRVRLPFAGPFNTVNGVIWPHLDVAAQWYRFRILNAANARTYRLELSKENRDGSTTPLNGAFIQIGTEQGFLGAPHRLDRLTLAPAERVDVLVNFGPFQGASVRLSTVDDGTLPLGREVMQFRVAARSVADPFVPPAVASPTFSRVAPGSLPAGHVQRWVASATDDGTVSGNPQMWELARVGDGYRPQRGDRLVKVVKGGVTTTFRRVALRFDDPVSFQVRPNDWEVWNFLHLSGPNHPTHIHLVSFQALSRDTYDVVAETDAANDVLTYTATYGAPKGLGPDELGWKDTIRIDEHDLVSVAAQFRDGTGSFVYHCHILEHEDHGMMRPFVVGTASHSLPPQGTPHSPAPGGHGGHHG